LTDAASIFALKIALDAPATFNYSTSAIQALRLSIMGEPAMRFAQWTVACTFCAWLTICCGCANHARLVERDNTGGIVAVPENSNRWPSYNRKHAEELMRANCPQGYTIVKEEEVVVGQTQHTQTNTDRSGSQVLAALHIDPVNEKTNQTTFYDDKKEWRIYYQANGATPTQTPPTAPRQ
jgi:hypothetical protein